MIEADSVEIPLAVRRRVSRMKAIRRSIKGDKDARSHHISISQKNAMSITAPKKVIRALDDYNPGGASDQLAFSKGDFFHVVGNENDEHWYEACNPATGARGLVPVSYFKALGKSEEPGARARTSSGSMHNGQVPHDSAYSGSQESLPVPTHRSRNSQSGRHATAYGMVQYDFAAERPDELQARAGEFIIIIAQSTEEWFVAKPIGRLGGPGLIPVAYIELKNMANGQSLGHEEQAAVRAAIPPVEDWKKTQADYKNSSIPLGRIDDTVSYNARQSVQGGSSQGYSGSSAPQSTLRSQDASQYANSTYTDATTVTGYSPPPSDWNDLPAPITATIPRYCHSGDKFWFVIEAQMEDGTLWQFSRFYEDFYDLQVTLLKHFPEEAGERGENRVIPFLPGPMPYVTNQLTEMRQGQLNDYLSQLVNLSDRISKSIYLRGFFAPKQGDYELDPDAPTDFARYSQGSDGSAHNVQHAQSSHAQQATHNGAAPSSQQYQDQPAPLNGSQHQYYPSSQNSAFNPPQPGYQNGYDMNSSQASLPSSTPTPAAVKFKLHYEDNIYVVRVPPDIRFDQLKYKIAERCNVQHELELNYKDESRGGEGLTPLNSENDWIYAYQNTDKLGVYVC